MRTFSGNRGSARGLQTSRWHRLGSCPACGVKQQLRCRPIHASDYHCCSNPHRGRPEVAWLEDGRVQCEGCGKFKFLPIHSCAHDRIRPALPPGRYDGPLTETLGGPC